MKSATEHWKQKPFWESTPTKKKHTHTQPPPWIEIEKKMSFAVINVWINENLLEYKASSSENSILENWKESGYEIGKRSILCLYFFLFAFRVFFRILCLVLYSTLCENPFVSFCFSWMMSNAQLKAHFAKKKKTKTTSVTSNDFG